jgi:hypothetical protein
LHIIAGCINPSSSAGDEYADNGCAMNLNSHYHP